MKKLFQNLNKKIIEKLIPEKGSDFEYHNTMMFTDPKDIAFDYPFECTLPHLLSEQRNNEEQFLFI